MFSGTTQSQHDKYKLQDPDLDHELLHVVFPLENKRPQVVKWDVVLHILGKTMFFHIDLWNEKSISIQTHYCCQINSASVLEMKVLEVNSLKKIFQAFCKQINLLKIVETPAVIT